MSSATYAELKKRIDDPSYLNVKPEEPKFDRMEKEFSKTPWTAFTLHAPYSVGRGFKLYEGS